MPANDACAALVAAIRDRILAAPQQRITFAEYMELVLYHPELGYYGAGCVEIGAKGDFFTSTSLGADFARCLGEQFGEMWQHLNCPQPFTLVEMGAGTGQVAADLCTYFEQHYPQIFANLHYIIIEQAPALKIRQQQLLESWRDRLALSWKSWTEIPDNSLIGCCFSNELIDALPVHLVTLENQQLREIYVTWDGDRFLEISGQLSTPQLADYFPRVGVELLAPAYPDGYRTEVNLAALDWLATVSQKLQQGYLLTIDYGYSSTRYYNPQRHQGTLQCYHQHHRHSDPYRNLGQQDITAHVDFTALERHGQQLGLQTLGLTKQGLFLMALGIGDRLGELSSGNYSVLEVLQRRDALHQLIDPAGLGNFVILLQGKNLRPDQQRLRGLNPDQDVS